MVAFLKKGLTFQSISSSIMEQHGEFSPLEHRLPLETMARDSMVTVRLSEPPALTVDTSAGPRERQEDEKAEEQHAIQVEDLQESPKITMSDPNGNEVESTAGSESGNSLAGSRRGSDSSVSESEEVNWEELEKTEEQEPRDQDSDDVGFIAVTSELC